MKTTAYIGRISMTLAVMLLLSGCSSDEAKVGEPLPHWKEGELDIHFINTARGECEYQILPDGTTILVDASGSLLQPGVEKSGPLPARPSEDITAGKVIADYIGHFNPEVSSGHIDYLLITHLHGDHIGSYRDWLPMHSSGLFHAGSLTEIGDSLVFDRIMDRDYPDYSYPTPEILDNAMIHNYRAFLEWYRTEKGAVVEKWNAGSHSQIVPVHDTSYGVTVQNMSGNGVFWTGNGEEAYRTMPTTEEFEDMELSAIPSENAYSCSYMLSYGDFDLFLGGDLQINGRDEYPYKDAESPVAKVAHKVEVMKANHHGTNNTNSDELLSVLRPDVWVACTWRDVQPRPATVDRVMKANPSCDIYCTNMPEINRPLLGDRLRYIKEQDGHIVVRVAEGGSSYMVYALDDTDQEYRVKSINGPYRCEK